MKLRDVATIGVIACLTVLGVWLIMWPHATAARTPVAHGPGAAAIVPIPKPVPQTVGKNKYWHDPSFSQKQLDRAYPPPRSLPPEARPQPSNIYPPEPKMKALRRKINSGEVIVY